MRKEIFCSFFAKRMVPETTERNALKNIYSLLLWKKK